MNQAIPGIYADIAAAESPGFFYQTFHHQLMGIEQILNTVRIKLRNTLVCFVRILHFPDILRRAEYTFPIDYIAVVIEPTYCPISTIKFVISSVIRNGG